jgi:hypothetical protein
MLGGRTELLEHADMREAAVEKVRAGDPNTMPPESRQDAIRSELHLTVCICQGCSDRGKCRNQQHVQLLTVHNKLFGLEQPCRVVPVVTK